MGAGFWILQATFAIAMIGTAVQVERQRRRDEESDTPLIKVPIAVKAGGLGEFTLLEQSRLLLLRRFVEEARAYKTHLYDDLVPDTPDPPAAREPHKPDEPHAPREPREARESHEPREAREPHAPPAARAPAAPPAPPRPWQPALLAAGLLLAIAGLVGIVTTNLGMNAIEDQQQSAHSALITRLLPGPIATPAKYLSAVNSAGGSSSSVGPGGDPTAPARMLDLKRNMDRFVALLGFGVVALLLYEARRQHAAAPPTEGEDEHPGGIGRDLIPFVGLVATLWALLSFFELP